MKRTLVIGYGNPLRADDGVGWHIIDKLREAVEDPALRSIKTHQLTPELAQTLGGFEQAVFIDARADAKPGELTVETVVAQDIGLGKDTHVLTPQALLSYAKSLYGFAPEAILIGIGAKSFDFSEELSDEVERAVPEALKAIEKYIRIRFRLNS